VTSSRHSRARLLALVVVWVLGTGVAHAYIGPGAGFAFAGSALALVATFFIAAGAIISWPVRLIWRLIVTGNPYKRARVKRVVILGLDGMDPGLTTRLMREGKLPHFQHLAEKGVFRALTTSTPGMSPVAWSSFTTGVDPSRHGIYDFLTRDPCTYAPMLSSTEIANAKKVLNIGKYVVPLDKPRIKLLQKSQAFWKLLGQKHITSTIQRVPITFPPVKFNGLLLSGMCVPDLRGSQGTFGFFSTKTEGGAAAHTGGEQTVLRRQRDGDVIRSRIMGPVNGMVKGSPSMTLPFTLTIDADRRGATFEIEGHPSFHLGLRQYSEWIELTFKAGLGVKVRGIARFYVASVEPEVEVYMTPIHIDPEHPAMPISHPGVYAVYLAKKQGKYATLGLAEDTWALNERVIDEQAFFDQALLICEERERMFLDAIARQKRGVVTCVFDTTDRVQHMFYRYLDPTHPSNAGKDTELHKDAIEKVYRRMDDLVGRIAHVVDDPQTCFIAMSDHGFTNFRRGVNLNAWLRDHGYLHLKDGATTSGDWFDQVDWSRTKAFSLGLTGMFINRKGRERSGIVAEGAEYDALKAELIAGLKALVDPQTGQRCVLDVFAAADYFTGPYRHDAPDLIVGYDGGYRNSWDCATGAVPAEVFSDNTKSWSGDHCVDPRIVPGVLFSNLPIATETPAIVDIAPSVMALFGQQPAKYMQGRPIFAPLGAPEAGVRGPLDPSTLNQSGAAPLARAVPETRPGEHGQDGARRPAPAPATAEADAKGPTVAAAIAPDRPAEIRGPRR
jgi:predicted AlkP superfamily phosphohydrolase/phosphomutase